MHTLRCLLLAACVACGLVLLGGHPAFAGDAKVSGMVTLKGKPLAAGRVIFHLDNDQFVGAKVKDGSFTVDRVPAGTRKVTVEGEGVPGVYASEDKSGLQVELKEGKFTFDIELK